jgi:Spy/CpxP family protein refolding chaperone
VAEAAALSNFPGKGQKMYAARQAALGKGFVNERGETVPFTRGDFTAGQRAAMERMRGKGKRSRKLREQQVRLLVETGTVETADEAHVLLDSLQT